MQRNWAGRNLEWVLLVRWHRRRETREGGTLRCEKQGELGHGSRSRGRPGPAGEQAERLGAGERKLAEVNDLQVFELAEERVPLQQTTEGHAEAHHCFGWEGAVGLGETVSQSKRGAMSAQRGRWELGLHWARDGGEDDTRREDLGTAGRGHHGHGLRVFKLHIVFFPSPSPVQADTQFWPQPGRAEAWWEYGTWLLS